MFFTTKKEIIERNYLKEIIELKKTFWNHDYESQYNWFLNNIISDDIHYLYYEENRLIGYGVKRVFKSYTIIDTIIVLEEFRGKGIGYKIVKELINKEDKPIYLLCEEKNIGFYKKNGFSEENKVVFNDKEILNLKIMSKNKNNEENEYIYYNHFTD